MWKQLVYLPAWRDMRSICKQHGFHPPELTLGQSSAAAGIFLTDWAFETPQPLPPKLHVSCHLQGLQMGCLSVPPHMCICV